MRINVDLGLVWAGAVGAFCGVVVYVGGKDDGKAEGRVDGLVDGFAAGLEAKPVDGFCAAVDDKPVEEDKKVSAE
jgi:hypothetical protein